MFLWTNYARTYVLYTYLYAYAVLYIIDKNLCSAKKKDFKVHLLRKHDFLDFVKINTKTISIFHTFYEFDNSNNNSFGHACITDTLENRATQIITYVPMCKPKV